VKKDQGVSPEAHSGMTNASIVEIVVIGQTNAKDLPAADERDIVHPVRAADPRILMTEESNLDIEGKEGIGGDIGLVATLGPKEVVPQAGPSLIVPVGLGQENWEKGFQLRLVRPKVTITKVMRRVTSVWIKERVKPEMRRIPDLVVGPRQVQRPQAPNLREVGRPKFPILSSKINLSLIQLDFSWYSEGYVSV